MPSVRRIILLVVMVVMVIATKSFGQMMGSVMESPTLSCVTTMEATVAYSQATV